jgi:hypothetical protein
MKLLSFAVVLAHQKRMSFVSQTFTSKSSHVCEFLVIVTMDGTVTLSDAKPVLSYLLELIHKVFGSVLYL